MIALERAKRQVVGSVDDVDDVDLVDVHGVR